MSLVLDATDEALLAGARGEGAASAMRLLVAYAEALGATSLVSISQAHIDGCLSHGRVSLDFVQRFVDLGARVAVPTTTNVGAIDLIHPEFFRGPADEGDLGAAVMRAHEALGCMPSFTCAPYQTMFRPRLGDQIAWGESNAIVFANSVIGARTERYGDFTDLLCALTGRAPFIGLHRDENRRAAVHVDVDTRGLDRNVAAVAVGAILGERCGTAVPVVTGLAPTTSEDDLKALGAVAASAGGVALFHAVGITPEAPTLEAATGGVAPAETIMVSARDLASAIDRLSTVPVGTALTAVSLGTPHFSKAEFRALLALLDGGPRAAVPVTVNTDRETLAWLEGQGHDATLADFGARLLVDTCLYLATLHDGLTGAVMTNSGKMAWYAPGNLDVEIAFGSLADCVASARAGRAVRA